MLPFDKENLPRMVKLVPIQENDELILVFMLPCYDHEYRQNPGSYFCYLIGQEGKGSLLSVLL